MKLKTRNKYFAWVVLICFLIGQFMVTVHRHLPAYAPVVHKTLSKSPQPHFSEKCYVCDMMHHTSMAIFTEAAVTPNFTISSTQYKCQHDYIGIALILSAGRSPPIA